MDALATPSHPYLPHPAPAVNEQCVNPYQINTYKELIHFSSVQMRPNTHPLKLEPKDQTYKRIKTYMAGRRLNLSHPTWTEPAKLSFEYHKYIQRFQLVERKDLDFIVSKWKVTCMMVSGHNRVNPAVPGWSHPCSPSTTLQNPKT